MRIDLTDNEIRIVYASLAEQDALRTIFKREDIPFNTAASVNGMVILINRTYHRHVTTKLMEWRNAMAGVFNALDQMRDQVLEGRVDYEGIDGLSKWR